MFVTDRNERIRIKFSDFDVQDTASCNKDRLTIEDENMSVRNFFSNYKNHSILGQACTVLNNDPSLGKKLMPGSSFKDKIYFIFHLKWSSLQKSLITMMGYPLPEIFII
jgi:hypothetical protein